MGLELKKDKAWVSFFWAARWDERQLNKKEKDELGGGIVWEEQQKSGWSC